MSSHRKTNLEWAEKKDVGITAHMPGDENINADTESSEMHPWNGCFVIKA